MTTVIRKTQLAVPSGVIVAAANLLLEHELHHQIVEADDDEDTITLELEYGRDQRDMMHRIQDLLDDYNESDDDDDDEDDEDEDENDR